MTYGVFEGRVMEIHRGPVREDITLSLRPGPSGLAPVERTTEARKSYGKKEEDTGLTTYTVSKHLKATIKTGMSTIQYKLQLEI